jgi:broad specificity phosphatase PhoE
MQIVLITHAHTEPMRDVAVDAWQLSTRGIEQTKALANAPFWANVDRVIVSSEPKTWLTIADVVVARHLPVWVDCRLDELRRSGWHADYATQVAEVFARPSQSVAGWEAADSASRRIQASVADLQNRFADERLALVGHGICLSLLRAKLMGRSHVALVEWQRLAFGTYALASLAPPTLLEDFVQDSNSVR